MGTTTGTEDSFVSQALIEPDTLEDREYQSHLYSAARHESTLIALPTGTGKTAVATRLLASRITNTDADGPALFLAPTQPLVAQHHDYLASVLTVSEDDIHTFTGETPPRKREQYWAENPEIVVATPQVIENDLLGDRYTLSETPHIVFDECHRATGNYAYTYVAEAYTRQNETAFATGLSASPGTNTDEVINICTNIGLTNVEVITEDDELLADYLPETTIDYVTVEMADELLNARDLIKEVYSDRLTKLKQIGVLSSASTSQSKSDILKAKQKIQRLIDNDKQDGYKAQSYHAEALKIHHAMRVLESQSPHEAAAYLRDQRTPTDGNTHGYQKRLQNSEKVTKAIDILTAFENAHPKFKRAREIVIEQFLSNSGGGIDPDTKALIFSESRETVRQLTEFFNETAFDAARFVGHKNKENDPGMSKRDQQRTIQQFKNGEHDILISTSVAEEGLDIPAVDIVVFYEPVPNVIRTVQRRGRTGRESRGSVAVMVAEDTLDETMYYVAQSRESKMKEQLQTLSNHEGDIITELGGEQSTLTDYDEQTQTQAADESYTIIADTRETKSDVIRELDTDSTVSLTLSSLSVGDYVLGNGVAVERKRTDDFVQSITADTERSLFTQAEELSTAYDTPILLIEGITNGLSSLYDESNISNEAIRGAIHSLTLDYELTVLFTDNAADTAAQLATVARREQDDSQTTVHPHGNKKTKNTAEMQQYIISSLPHIGPVIADRLLEAFDTPTDILTASPDALTGIEGIGDTTATEIHKTLTQPHSALTER